MKLSVKTVAGAPDGGLMAGKVRCSLEVSAALELWLVGETVAAPALDAVRGEAIPRP